jgi:hypothetical protein
VRLIAAVNRTARSGGRLSALNEASALLRRVKADLGDSASAKEVAEEVMRRAAPGGSGVVRVAGVRGSEVVVGVNPEVLRKACDALTSGAGEASPSAAEYTFAVEVLDAEEAVAAEFGQAATSQLSAGHAARLVVALIRTRAAAGADNKSVLQELKALGVVKNNQFQQKFLATFFPRNSHGRRLESLDARLDAMLDALEQGCEALLAKAGYTRGGAHPHLFDVQEALHLLKVASKGVTSDEEALRALRATLSKLEEVANDEKQLKSLVSFRKRAAGAASQAATSFAGYVRDKLGSRKAFRRLAKAAVKRVLASLEDDEKAEKRGLKALSAIFECAAVLESQQQTTPANAGEVPPVGLLQLQSEWRAYAAAATAAAAADTAAGAPEDEAHAAATADGAPAEVATADGALVVEVTVAAVNGAPAVAAAAVAAAAEPSSTPAEVHGGGGAPSQSRSADGDLTDDARHAARKPTAGAAGGVEPAAEAAVAAVAAEGGCGGGGGGGAASKPGPEKRRRAKSDKSPRRSQRTKDAAGKARRSDAAASRRSPEAASRRASLDSDVEEARPESPGSG